jgi:uncharacterized protein
VLLVHATKGRSRISGFGLIAREVILRGQIVWAARRGFDVFLSEFELRQLSAPAKEAVLFYAFFDPVREVHILSSDDDRFTNDSGFPNTRYDQESCCTRAIRKIGVGEEITVDYRELEARYPEWRTPDKSKGGTRRICGLTSYRLKAEGQLLKKSDRIKHTAAAVLPVNDLAGDQAYGK